MKRGRLVLIIGTVTVLICVIVLPRILSRQEPGDQQPETEEVLPVVTTVQPSVHQGHIMIRGNGTVRPLREVPLISEVSGKITSVAEEFVVGGSFRQGQEILRIDSTDYANAVTVAQAEVVQRKFDLLRAEEEMIIAKQEWELRQTLLSEPPSVDSTELGSLVFKEPQWKTAIAQLRSAEARLNDALARLERTRIVAPYNGQIRTKIADLDQFVAPGQVIASFYGTDAAEISVSIAGREVALLGDLRSQENTPKRARLVARNAGGEVEWDGVVHRTEGMLDESTRSLNAIVRIQNPYESTAGRPPLMMGTFVNAYLEGQHYDQYYTLPRESLRDGSVIWTIRDGRLYTQPVDIIQEIEDTLYILSGITEQDSIVINPLTVVTEGMRVRIKTD